MWQGKGVSYIVNFWVIILCQSSYIKTPKKTKNFKNLTSSSAIAERPRCRVGQFWPKVKDDILQTIYRVGQKVIPLLQCNIISLIF